MQNQRNTLARYGEQNTSTPQVDNRNMSQQGQEYDANGSTATKDDTSPDRNPRTGQSDDVSAER